MRILLISPLAPPAGGIATWTELYLKAEKIKNGNIIVDLVNSNVAGERVKNYSKKNMINEIRRSYRIFKELKKCLEENEYDIVHLNNSCSTLGMSRDFLLSKYIKFKKQKLIIHFHCDISVMIKDKLSKVLLKNLCRIADRRLVLNNSSQIFLENMGFNSNNIPNFFDMNSIEYKKRVYRDKIERIVFVGHIIKTKGCNEIIEIAKKFEDIEFRLIGNIGEEFKEKKYDKNIKLMGEVSKKEVIKELEEADIMLFPSYTEGFPNVIMEAMAVELPIIATNVGAIPDILDEFKEYLVEVKDTEKIIEKLSIFKSKKFRERYGVVFRKKLESKYSLEKIFNQICFIYRSEDERHS